jgi:hypothetical protein
LGEDPGKFRWADATILSLTLSVVTLIAAVQFSKYVGNDDKRAGRYYGATRILYHTGIVALLLGLGFVLAPLHASGVPDAPRWAACGIAFAAAIAEGIGQDRLGVRAVGLGVAAEARDVEARTEPEPGAHRRHGRAAAGARFVAGRPDVGAGGDLGGEPDRVRDRLAGPHRLLDLREIQQPGQDRQACRVG